MSFYKFRQNNMKYNLKISKNKMRLKGMNPVQYRAQYLKE